MAKGYFICKSLSEDDSHDRNNSYHYSFVVFEHCVCEAGYFDSLPFTASSSINIDDLVSKMGICTFCFAGIPFTFMNSPNCVGVRVECLTVPRIGSSICRLPFSKWDSKYMVCG
jgi:hypothetical protein